MLGDSVVHRKRLQLYRRVPLHSSHSPWGETRCWQSMAVDMGRGCSGGVKTGRPRSGSATSTLHQLEEQEAAERLKTGPSAVTIDSSRQARAMNGLGRPATLSPTPEEDISCH